MLLDFKSGGAVGQKVSKAITEFTNGGKLTTQQSEKFIEIAQERSKFLNRFKMLRMKGDSHTLPKLSVVGDMYKASPAAGTALSSGNQFNPTDGNITLNAKKLFATIPISYDTLALNVEGEGLLDLVLSMVAKKSAIELEKFAFAANTAGGFDSTDKLSLIDGIIKQADTNGNVYDAQGSPFGSGIVTGAMAELGDAYIDRIEDMVVGVNNKTSLEYREMIAQRNTQLGDAMFQGGIKPKANGAEVIGASGITRGNGLVFMPENVVFGINEEMEIHMEDRPTLQTLYIVIITRADAKIIDPNGVSLIKNIGNVVN